MLVFLVAKDAVVVVGVGAASVVDFACVDENCVCVLFCVW